jgi:hypothetical protein
VRRVEPLGVKPFDFQGTAAGGAGFGGAGGQPDLKGSSCEKPELATDGVICEGLAAVVDAPDGLSLVLDDGSTFTWQLNDISPNALLAVPLVHLRYRVDSSTICPFCGSVSRETLEITDAADPARILVHWSDGDQVVPTNDLALILGVSLNETPSCSLPSSAGCYLDVETWHMDWRLEGSSPAEVPYGKTTRIVTNLGQFSVYASSYHQTGTFDRGCADGSGLKSGGEALIIRQ